MSYFKPCSFCGGAGATDSAAGQQWTFCQECGVGYEDDPGGERWNTRVEAGWVTDRDPPEVGPYLAAIEGGSTWICEWMEGMWWWPDGSNDDPKVIAWRLLPVFKEESACPAGDRDD